ncbi:MAG: tRNA (N6-isopentenyl adenosine(37)-C2)-methylthiotransferase MiaB, partial [Ruminococcus sp.]|nr:tRNA (N6-isopentenyl adenosine(37)-C2)-methylthiotransferase MiaB [Ruminococcus sp.]
GFAFTDSYDDADLILFNTCAVRESAEERVYGILGNIKKYKRNNPNLIIALSGCMASEEKTVEKVKAHYPFVDIILGTASLTKLPDLLLEHFKNRKFVWDISSDGLPEEGLEQIRESNFKASVPIMFGCNNFCTYCIVPYVRGRERSRNSKEIIDEVKSLVDNGYKEIMLLGQNVNSYGNDLPDELSFSELLRALNDIPGEFVIRFMSSHPKDAMPELLDTILQCEKVGKHLHLPVQCGSNNILHEMNRRYTVEQYLQIVSYLRERDSDFSLSTDLIVGFPNESEEDFQGTLDLISKVKYDNIYTFIYSKRTGTKAAEMSDCTSDSEKRSRMERLLSLQREIATENYKRYIGRTLRVLVDGESKNGEGWLFGKSNEYIIVEFKGDISLVGKFVDVKITDSRNWAVSGELVSFNGKADVK